METRKGQRKWTAKHGNQVHRAMSLFTLVLARCGASNDTIQILAAAWLPCVANYNVVLGERVQHLSTLQHSELI